MVIKYQMFYSNKILFSKYTKDTMLLKYLRNLNYKEIYIFK